MTQVDILLRQLPQVLDVCIDREGSYDVIINDGATTGNVYIYDLVDRQSIYGDELKPLIFHLSENTVDCLLNVSLLETALLYRYDDMLLSEIDRSQLFVLDHGGGYNYFSLKENSVGISKTIYTDLQRHVMSLASGLEMDVAHSLGAERNNMTLTTSNGELINTTTIKAPALSTKLANHITADMSSICEIILNERGVHWLNGYLYEYDDMTLSEMNTDYPKMSLVTLCDELYVKISFELERNVFSLGSSKVDVLQGVKIDDAIRADMCLSADAEFTYHVVCSCDTIGASLDASDVSVQIIAVIPPEPVTTGLVNEVIQDAHIQSTIGVTSQSSLGTSITDDLELFHGLGEFDNELLSYWDEYTIAEMAAMIVKPQSKAAL